MQVKVIKLRENGQRLSKERTTLSYSMEGDLEVIQYVHQLRSYSYARLSVTQPTGMSIIKDGLYEPKLVKIDGEVLMLDGLEKVGERLTFQQWKCLIV